MMLLLLLLLVMTSLATRTSFNSSRTAQATVASHCGCRYCSLWNSLDFLRFHLWCCRGRRSSSSPHCSIMNRSRCLPGSTTTSRTSCICIPLMVMMVHCRIVTARVCDCFLTSRTGGRLSKTGR
uniref:Putative secreted protein n=1 Tax=Anopheles marajoara TaxID=58244 RepID=A0A2M4C758_9DIPT